MSVIIGQEKPSLEELAHHGVKGMHWGVRKDEYTSTDSRSQRKAASSGVSSYMFNAIAHEPLLKTMTPEEYASLSTKSETFAKGIALHRISKSDSTKIDAGALYVSKFKSDHDFYTAALGGAVHNKLGIRVQTGKKNYKSPSYDVTLKTVEKLKLPSDKERVDAFMNLLSTPSIKIEGRDAPISGRQYLEEHGYKYLMRNKNDLEATFSAYPTYLQEQGKGNSEFNIAYFKSLQEKGYNAVVDANDAGRFTTKPLIILNPDKSVKTTNIRRLSASEINEAQRALASRKSPGQLAGEKAALERKAAKAKRKAEKERR